MDWIYRKYLRDKHRRGSMHSYLWSTYRWLSVYHYCDELFSLSNYPFRSTHKIQTSPTFGFNQHPDSSEYM